MGHNLANSLNKMYLSTYRCAPVYIKMLVMSVLYKKFLVSAKNATYSVETLLLDITDNVASNI